VQRIRSLSLEVLDFQQHAEFGGYSRRYDCDKLLHQAYTSSWHDADECLGSILPLAAANGSCVILLTRTIRLDPGQGFCKTAGLFDTRVLLHTFQSLINPKPYPKRFDSAETLLDSPSALPELGRQDQGECLQCFPFLHQCPAERNTALD